MDAARESAKGTALGTLLCILSPVFLILLSGLSTERLGFRMSDEEPLVAEP